MESIGKCLLVIKATFEMRNSRSSSSRYQTDLEAFRRGSLCDTEPLYGTPTNKVLLHLFGIACNEFLGAANVPLISGPRWTMDYSINLGFLSMLTSSDDFIEKVRLDETLKRYEYVGHRNFDGFAILPNGDPSIIYRKSSSELLILFENAGNAQRSLLSWNGTSGWLRYFPVSYMFIKSPAVGAGAGGQNAHVVSCDNVDMYAIHACADITSHVYLGNSVMTPGLWTPFQRGVNLNVDVAARSGMLVEYVINSYTDSGDEHLFEHVPLHETNNLKFLPPFSHGPFGVMYTQFITHICSIAHVVNPYPEVLGIIDPNCATKALINIIIMLNDMINE